MKLTAVVNHGTSSKSSLASLDKLLTDIPSNAALPYCFYFTNTQANQYAWYCTDTPSAPFTTAYEVNMVYTSTAGFPTITQPGPSPGQTASSTTSTATSTSPAVGTSHSSLSTGAIAGIAVAGVLLGILFALIAVCLFKWKRKRQPAQMQASAGPFTGAFEYDFYANGRDYGHETQTGAPTMEVSGESRRVVEVEGSTPSTFQDKWTPSQKTISSFSSPYQSPRITSKPSNPNLKGSAENGNLQQIEELDSGGITKSQAQSQQSQQPCPAYWGDLYQSLEGRSLDSSFDRSATGDNVADSDHSTHEVETEEET